MKLYEEALEHAEADLEQAQSERDRLESRLEVVKARIKGLQRTVASLNALLGESGWSEVGLTDAVRELLRGASGSAFSAVDLRDRLRSKKFPVDAYKQPLAVLHTTLKRLSEQGEVRTDDSQDKTRYQWIETERDKPT